MKKLLIVAAVIVVLIVVLALLLVSNLDSLVAKAIEKSGSGLTQTRVSVSGVDISLREGHGSIKGLRIANPPGYRSGTALALEDITIDLDVKSVRKDPIVIEEVRIQAPTISAEITKTGGSNIDELRKRVQAATAGKSGQPGKSAKRIRIDRFVFERGRVEVDASSLGLEKSAIDLPEIRLENVGGANGAPPDEIGRIILTTVAEKAASEIAGSEIDRLVKEKLGGSLGDKAKGLFKKIGG